MCAVAQAQDSSKSKRELTDDDFRKIIASTSDYNRPTLIQQTTPRYTREAKDARLEGSVGITLKIDEKGKVVDTKVEKRLGMGLDEEAVAAVREWRFKPATKAGKAVATSLYIEVAFRMSTSPAPPKNSLPQLVSKVDPAYTEEARKARVEGKVRISFVVNAKGQPEQLRVEKGLGMGLDEEAMKALLQWRYTPGYDAGRPVSHMLAVDVPFKLP
jgi:TonB family protein